MLGDYTNGVWDRTYLAQDKLKGLDIMLGQPRRITLAPFASLLIRSYRTFISAV